MHELAVTRSILEIALRHAAAARAARITDLYLVLGELSTIIDDSVQFYWDFISEHTIAVGADLHFRRIPAKLLCTNCQHIYHPAAGLACPVCDAAAARIIAGEEFFLEAIDIATEEDIKAANRTGPGHRPPASANGDH